MASKKQEEKKEEIKKEKGKLMSAMEIEEKNRAKEKLQQGLLKKIVK